MSIDESIVNKALGSFEAVYPASKEFKYFLIHNA